MHRSVFDAAGGMDGLRRLASAWHARVMADEVVSHAFSHGFHPQHTDRLAAYWAEALGGPAAYSDAYGDETSVVRIHSGNGVHEDMDRRAIACFDDALVDAGLAADDRLRPGATRLLRLGDHHLHGPIPRVRRRQSPTACLSCAGPGTDWSIRSIRVGARSPPKRATHRRVPGAYPSPR